MTIEHFNVYISILMKKQLDKIPLISGWQAYIVHLLIPYINCGIEGDEFSIQWLCKLLNVNIYTWDISL